MLLFAQTLELVPLNDLELKGAPSHGKKNKTEKKS
jgi:hypothetical protein